MPGYPYKNPYTRQGRFNVGQPTVDDAYRSADDMDAGHTVFSIQPGEPVPPGFVVVDTLPGGGRVVAQGGAQAPVRPTAAPSSSGNPIVPIAAGGAIVNEAMGLMSGGGSAASAGGGGVGAITPNGTHMVFNSAEEAIAAGATPVSSETAAASATAPGSFALEGIGSSGNLLLPVAGAALGANLLHSDIDNDARGWGRGVGQGAASGAMMGSYFGLPGAAIGAGIGGLVGAGKVALRHKDTKEYQKERWGKVIQNSKYQDLMAAGAPGWMKGEEGDDGVFDSGPLAGKRWDQVTKAEIIADNPLAANLWLGNLDTAGDRWHEIPLSKRAVIIKRAQEEGLYDDDKGDVIIFSENQPRFLEIVEEVMNDQAADAEGQAYVDRWNERQAGVETATTGAEPPPAAPQAGRPGPAPIPADSPIAQNVRAQTGDRIPKKPNYEELVAKGLYRRGSKRAGGYVNNKTNEWVAG